MGTSAPARRAWAITLLFTAVIAVTYAFGVYLFPLLLPDMKSALGFGYAEAGSIAGLRQIAFLLTAMLSGAATVRLGAGTVILGSVVVCGVALCGLAMSPNLWTVAVLLIVMNACAASAWIPMVSLITKVVDYRHQGKSVGLIASGTNFGLCLNGLMVPVLMSEWGWRSVWLATGGLTVLLAVPLWAVLARASLMKGPLRQKSEEPPARNWRGVAVPRYLFVYILSFLGGLAGVASANYMSAYIRSDLHLSIVIAGQVWLVMGVAGATAGIAFGAVGDKLGLRAALLGAATLLGSSAVLIAMGRTEGILLIAGACFGGSFFPIFGLLPTYVGKTSEPGFTAIICSVVECALGLGGAVGSFLGGLAPHVFGSFRPVYLSAAIVAALMIGVISKLPGEREVTYQWHPRA
jgi:predicted MFS family arabinose efflux permease